jgi:CheY-like chemotaxis protein
VAPVIVVDDDPDLREGLRDLLAGEGYLVHTAENGERALEMIRSVGDGPIVLLDLMMPVMDGWHVLDELRRQGCALPVIVVSAGGNGTLEERAIRRGAVAFLRKPFQLGTLLGLLRAHAA